MRRRIRIIVRESFASRTGKDCLTWDVGYWDKASNHYDPDMNFRSLGSRNSETEAIELANLIADKRKAEFTFN